MEAAITASVVEEHKHSDESRLPAYSVHMDAARAFAAFLVLAGHARILFFGAHRSQAEVVAASRKIVRAATVPGLGYQAVIVFFVLSGFLVGGSAWRAMRSGRWSWRNYLLKRLTRLWIVLLPALLVGGSIDLVGRKLFPSVQSIYHAPAGQGMIGPDLAERSTFPVLAGNAVFLQTIRVPMFGTNAALWSLANEFWYYMTFPLVLLFLTRRAAWQRLIYLALTIAVMVFVGKQIAFLFLIWLFGCVVGLLPLTFPARYRSVLTGVCLLQFLAVNAMFRKLPINPTLLTFILGLSFSILLYAILHARQPIKSLAYQRLATGFSKFSYSLYLVHLPMLILLTAIFNRPWHAWPKNTAHLLESGALVIATYIYAFCFSLVFERNTDRLRDWINTRIWEKESAAVK